VIKIVFSLASIAAISAKEVEDNNNCADRHHLVMNKPIG